MPDTSGIRHILRIPPYEPPFRHDRPRRYTTRRATAHDGRSPRPERTGPAPATFAECIDPAAAAFANPTDAGSAMLLRTRLRSVDTDTAELFGSYTRGGRVLALAGRVTRTAPTRRTPHGWLITSLWLG